MSIGCRYCHDKNCLETCAVGLVASHKSALSQQEGGLHYKQMKIQPVEYIHANEIGFCEGSVIKYVTRWKQKNGIEDLKKARHFLDLLIELEERKGPQIDREAWRKATEGHTVTPYDNVDSIRRKLGDFLETPFPNRCQDPVNQADGDGAD